MIVLAVIVFMVLLGYCLYQIRELDNLDKQCREERIAMRKQGIPERFTVTIPGTNCEQRCMHESFKPETVTGISCSCPKCSAR